LKGAIMREAFATRASIAFNYYRTIRNQTLILLGPIAMAGFVVAAIVAADQSQEIFRGIATPDDPATMCGSLLRDLQQIAVSLRRPDSLLLFASAVACALSFWHWSRFTLSALGQTDAGNPPLTLLIASHAPRLIGASPLAALSVAFWCARLDGGCALNANLAASAVLYAILAVAFYWFFAGRRVTNPNKMRVVAGKKNVKVTLLALNVTARIVLGSSAILWIVLVFAFALAPQWFGPHIGSATIFLLWGALFLAPVALVSLAARRTDLPIAGIVLSVAVIFALLNLNSNHGIDLVKLSKTMPAKHQTAKIDSDFVHWLQTRPDISKFKGRPYPVYLIAAEGGGIRAEYFAAITLAFLQDTCPKFAGHVYLINGVSGGAFGAGIFGGLLHEAERTPSQNSDGCAQSVPDEINLNGWYVKHADAIAGSDTLSPVLGSLFFDGSVQAFLPWGIPAFDNGHAQVRAIEAAWRNEMHDDLLTEPVVSLRRSDLGPWVIFSTTRVEDGMPYPVTGVQSEDTGPLASWFSYASKRLPSDQVSAAWAMSLSGRFPWVTPPGSAPGIAEQLPNSPAEQDLLPARFVDGGYYENSGSGILADAVLQLESDPAVTNALREKKLSVAFHIIVLSNGDAVTNASSANASSSSQAQGVHGISLMVSGGLGDVLDPVRTLMNVRAAHAELTVDRLMEVETRNPMRNGSACPSDTRPPGLEPSTTLIVQRIQLLKGAVPIPLGWYLAEGAKRDMRRQLVVKSACTPTNMLNGETVPFAGMNRCTIQCVLDSVR
jgi:hypothetical protein